MALARYAHAQGLVLSDVLLLSILKAFAHCTGSLYITLKCLRFSVCVVIEVTVAPTPIAGSFPHRAIHPLPHRDHVVVCALQEGRNLKHRRAL